MLQAINQTPMIPSLAIGHAAACMMREIGIMPGKENNRFRPKDGYTQEQAVVTVERAVSGCEAILKLFFSVDFSVHIPPQISSLWMFAAVLFL